MLMLQSQCHYSAPFSSNAPVLSNADGLVDLHSSGVSVDDLWALRASDLLFPHVI